MTVELKCNGCWELLDPGAAAFATKCSHLFCEALL